jgi:hypothetical protein
MLPSEGDLVTVPNLHENLVWRCIGPFQGGRSVAVSGYPVDSSVIHTGMGETTIRGNVSHGDRVHHSTDASRTLQRLGLEEMRGIGKLRVDPRDPDGVFVAAFGLV